MCVNGPAALVCCTPPFLSHSLSLAHTPFTVDWEGGGVRGSIYSRSNLWSNEKRVSKFLETTPRSPPSPRPTNIPPLPVFSSKSLTSSQTHTTLFRLKGWAASSTLPPPLILLTYAAATQSDTFVCLSSLPTQSERMWRILDQTILVRSFKQQVCPSSLRPEL